MKFTNTEVFNFKGALPILNFPEYKITKEGAVIGKRGKVLVGRIDRCGYKEVVLSYYPIQKNALVHRLVLSTFNPIDNMKNLDVNHKDGNKLNNNLNNLEWCTRSENIIHSYKNGLQKVATNTHGTFDVLTEEKIKQIYKLYIDGLIDKEIAKIVGCSRELVGRKIREGGLR